MMHLVIEAVIELEVYWIFSSCISLIIMAFIEVTAISTATNSNSTLLLIDCISSQSDCYFRMVKTNFLLLTSSYLLRMVTYTQLLYSLFHTSISHLSHSNLY
jgi:hypothetical protein